MLATAVSRSGRVLRTARRTTPGRRVEARLVEDALTEAVQEIAGIRRIGAIGIAAAGFVDAQGERVRFAPHLPWRDEPLAANLGRRLREQLVGEVLVDNDANAALWAEARFGAAQRCQHAVMLTLGTGIGGALLASGTLAAPTVLIDPYQSVNSSQTTPRGPVVIGPVPSTVDSTDPGFSFINRGTIQAAPTDSQVSSLAFAIRGNSTTNYTCLSAVVGSCASVDGSGNPIMDGATQKTFTFEMSVSGAPKSGDNFTVSLTGAGSADNRNAQSVLGLQTKGTVGVGADGKGISFTDAYAKLVSNVGGKTAQATMDGNATNALQQSALDGRNSVSGVSVDEEVGNLVKFQQYYTASSQIIKAAQETFATLINSL